MIDPIAKVSIKNLLNLGTILTKFLALKILKFHFQIFLKKITFVQEKPHL